MSASTDDQLARINVERSIARLLLLRAHEGRGALTRPEIEGDLKDFSQLEVGEALRSLHEEGVIDRVGGLYGSSRSARRLDLLIA